MQTGIENTQLNQDNLQSNPLTQEEPKGIENTQLHNAETTQPDTLAQPVPAQKQLPADTYLYANTSHLGGVIQSTAKEYDIDPHKLEALMYNIQSGQAELSGYYAMSVSAYPGMSAEAYTRALGKAIDLANTVSEDERIQALQRGEEYTSNGIDAVIDSMVSKVEGKTGQDLFQARLTQLQQADNIKFDTIPLAQYYETLVKGGTDKGTAWLRTMALQDEYRKSQGYKAVKQDLDALVTPAEMQRYTNDLYAQINNTTDAEKRLRLYDQWEAATRLTKAYSEAYYNDPATYLQTKDPAVQAVLMDAQETGSFADVVKALDERYEEYGVQYSDRKYLRKDQAESIAKEINTFINTDPIKAQAAIVGLTQTYGVHADKVISQLIADKHIPASAKLLIESARTGSPKTNEAVISMLKYKSTYGNKFDMEMLSAPDSTSAKALRDKLESQIIKTPGFKSLEKQLAMTGNIAGYKEMLQAYGDIAAYYKFKNPRMSDKDIAKLVQKDFVESVYAFDADNRTTLQHRTLDGKPILYNGYSANQATEYLSNRKFTGQNLRIGALSKDKSEALLRNTDNIHYITRDQFTVQPVYMDKNGVVQSLYKVDSKGNILRDAKGQPIPYTLNLKHLGDEDILGVFNARDNARKLYKTLNQLVNIPTPYEMARLGATLDDNSANAMKALSTLGFQIDKFDTTKPFVEQFDRSKMSTRRIQALSTLLKKQVEFEQELEVYERMKKVQRNHARPRLIVAELVGPFIHTMLLPPKSGEESPLEKRVKAYERDKQVLFPELKAQRVKLQMIEKTIMDEACIYLNYKGKLPNNPLTNEINEHNLMDKVLWGGYGY